jgi:hypothetical protein
MEVLERERGGETLVAGSSRRPDHHASGHHAHAAPAVHHVPHHDVAVVRRVVVDGRVGHHHPCRALVQPDPNLEARVSGAGRPKATQNGSRAGFSEDHREQKRDREPLRKRGQSDSEDAGHGLGVLPRECDLRVEPLAPGRVREAKDDEEGDGPGAAFAEPLSRPEDERRDSEREEENQRIAPSAMQPGAEEIAEFPAVIGIERRLEEFPGRVQSEGKARDRKLREPARQTG